MTSDFLADLDAAVQQRCACLCGRPITASSPSAYFAFESCAERWHQANAGVPAADSPELLLPAGVAHVFVEICSWIGESIQLVYEQVEATFRPLARALSQAIEVTARAMQLDRQPPDDPMQRALYLRRNRNTGPHYGPRPPRRLDPGRGLGVVALGRAAYRPGC